MTSVGSATADGAERDHPTVANAVPSPKPAIRRGVPIERVAPTYRGRWLT
jgi:hypothetical protein